MEARPPLTLRSFIQKEKIMKIFLSLLIFNLLLVNKLDMLPYISQEGLLFPVSKILLFVI
jgi:hypothetical protein